MNALLLAPIVVLLLLSPLSAEPAPSSKQASARDCILTSLGQAESSGAVLTTLGQAELGPARPVAGDEDMFKALGQAESATPKPAEKVEPKAGLPLSAAATERI